MKPLMWIGALLTALGILSFLAQSDIIPYNSRKQLPSDGQSQVTVKEEKVVSIPPLLSGLALVAGAGLMIVAARK